MCASSMPITNTNIDGIKIFDPGRHFDERGWLSELWNPGVLETNGFRASFVQDILTFSSRSGTVHGMHFQFPPHDQGKLVICLSGAIFDVALDIRGRSPTYGRHVELKLCGDDPRQCWIPSGFAHGYCTLEPNTKVLYKLTAPYQARSAGGVLWKDVSLKIDWPIDVKEAVVNDRDNDWPCLGDIESPFRWDG